MTRSPDSLIPSGTGQPVTEKRDDKAFKDRKEGEANLRTATQVNVVSASSQPPVSNPIQLEIFPGRVRVARAKSAMDWKQARQGPIRRDGVQDGSTQRQHIQLTRETLFGLLEVTPSSREAHKGGPRKRRTKAGRGVGGGHTVR